MSISFSAGRGSNKARSLGNSLFPLSSLRARAIALAAIAMLLSAPLAAEPQKNPTLLELYTSQGCSSCPPADALLGELSERDDVVALTMPVSYWDYLGWKDTLAKKAFTQRQYDYASARGDRQVYTPQVVVNGVAHVVGSRRHEIDAAIKSTKRMLSDVGVALSAEWQGRSVRIKVGQAPDGSERRSGNVYLACFRRSVPVAIGRGENSGRRITYTNVVRELVPISRWEGKPLSETVKIPPDFSLDEVAIFLQADQSHAILGATVAAR